MADSFKIDIKVESPDRQTMPYASSVLVDAYGTVKVKVPCTATTDNPVEVEVQPSHTDQLKFLMIGIIGAGGKAGGKEDYVGPIRYSVDESSDNWITLAGLQVIPDNGLLPKLFPTAPKTFRFTNDGDKDREILILVGRKAVTSGPQESCEGNEGESTAELDTSQNVPVEGEKL